MNTLNNMQVSLAQTGARLRGLYHGTSKETRATCFMLFLILPLLVTAFLADLGSLTDYTGDENVWITVGSRAFQLYVVEHALTDPFWRDDVYTWGAPNPQIGKYLIGLGTYLAGYRDIPLRPFDFRHTLAWNLEHGTVHPREVVRAARTPVAVLGVVACLLLFWLATLVAGRWQGYLAVCSLVGARLFLTHARRAMIDVPALCLSLLALVCLIYLLRALRTHQRWTALGWSSATGIACGLAAGSKMNAVLILGVCVLALLLEGVVVGYKERRWPRRELLSAGVVVILASLVFFASNPFLYPDPVAGVRHLLGLSRRIGENAGPSALTTLPAKAVALWHGILYYAPLNQLGLPGDRWLWLLGCIGLVSTAWQTPQVFWSRGLAVIVLWIGIMYLGIGLWLPVDYSRYYIPLLPANAFLQAYGIMWFARMMQTYINRRLVQRPGCPPHQGGKLA